MAKVLLISENRCTLPYPVYPMGMGLIAAALIRGGHAVRQHDLLFPSAPLPEVLDAFRPDVVAVSIRNLDSADSTEENPLCGGANLRELVGLIRRHSAARVLLGGTGFSILPETLLAECGADAGIAGPGESEICALVGELARGEPGPLPVRSGRFDPRITPAVDFELARRYQEAGGMLGVMTKRGCTHRCAYCIYPKMDGKVFLPYDPRRVAAFIKELEEKAGVEEIFFTDSVFNDAHGYAAALAREMVRQKTRVRFAAYFSPARLDLAELDLFREAGLHAVELGTDAATDTTLRGLGKSFTFAQVEAFQAACVERRIPCAHYIIFGGPDETPQTLDEGLGNLARLPHCVVIGFSGVRVYRGTRLHARAVREGRIKPEDPLLKPYYYFSGAVDAGEMNERITRAFRGRRDRIFPPHRAEEITATLRRLGYKGVLWDTLIRF